MHSLLVQTAHVEIQLTPFDPFTIRTPVGRIHVERITVSAWHITLTGRKVNLLGKVTDRRVTSGPVEGYLDKLPAKVGRAVRQHMTWLARPAEGYTVNPHGLTKTTDIGADNWMALLGSADGQDNANVTQLKSGSAAS